MQETYTPQELAFALRKLIANRPEDWEQNVWYGEEFHGKNVEDIRELLKQPVCGSQACVAGWAAIFTSPKGSVLVGPDDDTADQIRFPDGTSQQIATVGQQALGLDFVQADWLFNGWRDESEVLNALEAIEEGRDWDPSDFAL